MVQKVNLTKLREDIRAEYTNFPTNGDPVLEFEQRHAGVIADLAVMMVAEDERGTPMETILHGLCGVFAVPFANACHRYSLNREVAVASVAAILNSYVVDEEGVTDGEPVHVERVDVGDA